MPIPQDLKREVKEVIVKKEVKEKSAQDEKNEWSKKFMEETKETYFDETQTYNISYISEFHT